MDAKELIKTVESGRLDEKLTETFAAMRADGTMKQIVGKYLPDPEKYLEVDALEP